MRAWFPRLAAALAVGWGALGLAALAGLLWGRVVTGQIGWVTMTTPILLLLAFGVMTVCLIVALVETAARAGAGGRTTLLALGAIVLVPAGHAVGVFAVLGLLGLLLWSPLFGATLDVASIFYWAVLSGGSWAGLMAGAIAAAPLVGPPVPGRWPARLAAAGALLGMAAFADHMRLRGVQVLDGAPFLGTVTTIGFALGTGWIAMLVGGWLASQPGSAQRRRTGLGIAALGGIWAGAGGCVAYAWMLQAVTSPVPPGTNLAGWGPSPVHLADAIQVMGILLPTPVLVGALCGIAWLAAQRQIASGADPANGYNPLDVR